MKTAISKRCNLRTTTQKDLIFDLNIREEMKLCLRKGGKIYTATCRCIYPTRELCFLK